MKAIPKFQSGNSFSLFFTTYAQLKFISPEKTKETSSSKKESTSSSSKSKSSDSDKGKLTEKDLFNMIKDIDGLPNEMSLIVSNLMGTFNMSLGSDLADIASTYLSNLYKIRLASQNKATYDEVKKDAISRGALNEIAISPQGGIIVKDDDGKFSTISAETYLNNRDSYTPLTVSDVLTLRAQHPAFVNNSSAFDIVSSSIGYEGFLKLLDLAKISLGSSEYSTTNVTAARGLEQLERMSDEEKELILSAISADATEGSTYKTNLPQIKALVDYLVYTLPRNAKTWAVLKTGIEDPNKATKALVSLYLAGQTRTTETYKESARKASSKGSKGSGSGKSGGSDEDPRYGFWAQVLTGTVGTPLNIVVSPKENDFSKAGFISTLGILLGTTPGLNENKSLQLYISDSSIGYIITNPKNITFGDQKISEEGFDDIVVNASQGASVAILPITTSGEINFDLLDAYTSAMKELENSGLDPNSLEYKNKLDELFSSLELEQLKNSDGSLNPSKFGKFLILSGVANSNTRLILNDEQGPISIDDIKSKYIIDKSDNEDLKRMTLDALSSKEKGNYEIDNFNWINPFDWGSSFYTHFYKANIYIPISEKRNSAMLADDNLVKESTMYDYEHSYLILLTKQDTSSK